VSDLSLIVRRTIRASPERVFAAWTEPEQLQRWWGPTGVVCTGAEVDLRVGGRYRIGNRLPDGSQVWISGEFEQITPPHCLVYTWRTEDDAGAERITVRFEAREGATEVIVVHERIASARLRDGHEAGWQGCLEGLDRHVADA
jgi:uncharacterized protein YndB with AHSA1/START domain